MYRTDTANGCNSCSGLSSKLPLALERLPDSRNDEHTIPRSDSSVTLRGILTADCSGQMDCSRFRTPNKRQLHQVVFVFGLSAMQEAVKFSWHCGAVPYQACDMHVYTMSLCLHYVTVYTQRIP